MATNFGYNKYNEYNRLSNLDGIEGKMIDQLVNSEAPAAIELWKLLKYATTDALTQTALTQAEKWDLVCEENGHPTDKRVFAFPFIDDAWLQECSCLYFYVDWVRPTNQYISNVIVTVETVTSSKLGSVTPNSDPITNSKANPNDYHGEGLTSTVVVPIKSRATLMLHDIIAIYNGLYIDGVGYLGLDGKRDEKSYSEQSLWNNRTFFGHSTHFVVPIGAVAQTPGYC
jgi:hypothetical protein